MTNLTKLLLAAAAPASLLAALPAAAQSVAVADPEAAVANTRAFTNATQQIKTQYKTQLDQADARRAAIQAELKPMYDAIDTDRDGQISQSEAAAHQAQVTALQQRQQSAQQELARIEGPASLAQQYALDQISAKLQAAVQSAVTKRGVTLLLKPAAAMYATPASDITSAITAELDATVPSVSITPPPGWQPGQPTGAAPAAAAPATGKKQTSGR